jgi:UDP-glucose 4-epimerase
VHVKDVVRANFSAMEADLPSRFAVFNVGTGRQTSLLDVLNELGRNKGAVLSAVKHPERPGDIRHSVASIESARKILHYDPAIALNAGLSTLCER